MSKALNGAEQPTQPPLRRAAIDLDYRPRRMERFLHPVAALPDGEPLFLPIQLMCGARPGPRLAAVAGVHGDELDGIRALHVLAATLNVAELAGTLILAPVVNVLAFNACTRRTPVGQQDLNRLFPGRAAGTISEQLAYHLCQQILVGCDLVVSLHGWSQNGLLTPWMEFVDIPGPIGAASHAAACAFGIPDLVPLPLLPGRLISALAELGIPAIEGEVGGQATVVAERWQIYVRGLQRTLAQLGMTTTPLAPRPESVRAPNYWALGSALAPAGGLVARQVELGDWVQLGQPLATISDLFGEPVATVAAPEAGKIASVQTVGVAQPGAHLFTILTPTQPRYTMTPPASN